MRGEVLWEGPRPTAIEVQHPISEVVLIVVELDGAPRQFPGFVPDQYTNGSSGQIAFMHGSSLNYIGYAVSSSTEDSFTLNLNRTTAYIEKVTAYLI